MTLQDLKETGLHGKSKLRVGSNFAISWPLMVQSGNYLQLLLRPTIAMITISVSSLEDSITVSARYTYPNGLPDSSILEEQLMKYLINARFLLQ